MDFETDPVAENEWVLRRIHRQHYQGDSPCCVIATAFRPTEDDDTGISVFREAFIQQPTDVLTNLDPEKQANYYLARLSVRELKALGLSVVPEPDPSGPPGHAVIPELSKSKYLANKKKLKEIHVALAILASKQIIHEPK